MQKSQYKTWVEVSAKNLQHNLRVFQHTVGKDVAVMAIVKSNAYGHGLVEVARAVSKTYNLKPKTSGCFGVDSIDEALALKKSGIQQPILILGYVPKPLLPEVVKHNFRVSLYDLDVLKALARIAKNIHKKALVHIKIETGTYRQGVLPEDLPTFIRALQKHAQYISVEGIYSHFADTEDTKSSYYKTQLDNFEKAMVEFNAAGISLRYVHMASSAGSVLYPEARYTMARLGISLYGLYPSEDVKHSVSDKNSLRPALTWKTCVAQVKTVPAGATVGYSRTYKASSHMQIAILPVGYWDGFDRRFSNNGLVLLKGRRCSVVGKICMNIMMIDVTDIQSLMPGDEAVLLGKQGKEEITAEELAERVGTINYEIVTRINPLIPRLVV